MASQAADTIAPNGSATEGSAALEAKEEPQTAAAPVPAMTTTADRSPSTLNPPVREDAKETVTNKHSVPQPNAPHQPAPSASAPKMKKTPGVPSLLDLCKVGGVDHPTPRAATIEPPMREEIKYMYIHEYADGLNKLLETQWYTSNGIERLFANYTLQQQFAGTLEMFARSKNKNFDEMIRMPPTERKLVMELMLLPQRVPNPNPADTELQTVIARLHVLECLLTGRVIQASPTSIGGFPQPGMDPRQSHFWRHLGDGITQGTLCNWQYGTPTWPTAFQHASNTLVQMKIVLDAMENRDVLYSMAVLRHLGPRHLQPLAKGELVQDLVGQKERAQVAVAKKFLEDQASGWGTTQVVQRICGMFMTGLNHWQLL